MKSLELLKKLQANPHYKLTEQEEEAIKKMEAEQSESKTSSVEDSQKKRSTKGNAAVKETGKLKKHSTDPVKE